MSVYSASNYEYVYIEDEREKVIMLLFYIEPDRTL